MFWKNDDGIAVAEMITLLALVGIMTFSALPFYNNLITHTHQTKVKTMYNKIKTSIIIAATESISVTGMYKVPIARQVASNKIVNLDDSSNWENSGDGIWTYIPTGAQIIYNRITDDDYSLLIKYRD